MTRKVALKVLVMAIISVVTWSVTSSVVARVLEQRKSAATPPSEQRKPAATPSSRAGKMDIVTSVRPITGNIVANAPRQGLTAIPEISVQPVGDGFRVSGQATVSHTDSNTTFVWAIRVRDTAKQVFVAERRYDTQVFQIPQGTAIFTPTFDDSFKPTLEPGSYNVELVLYRVPKAGLAALDDPDVKRAHVMAKNSVSVKIGG